MTSALQPLQCLCVSNPGHGILSALLTVQGVPEATWNHHLWCLPSIAGPLDFGSCICGDLKLTCHVRCRARWHVLVHGTGDH